ncbi:MAG: radical SAM protein, partial [Deltaproteobacteria bacterium]|nr:radical SAM protein [Deltaproteobacteria bacterium]
HFCFPNGLRGDILDESVLDALKAGGTYAMSIAIETVTPRLQDLVEKNLKIDKAANAIEQADRRGIMAAGFFMLGFPTETVEEMKATVDFALRSRLTTAYFFCVVPQPATPMYELAKGEAPEALEAAWRDEEEGANYRSSLTWYERAYGFPLSKFIDQTYRRFYLRPSRMARVVRRVPPKSWWLGSQRLFKTIALRDSA